MSLLIQRRSLLAGGAAISAFALSGRALAADPLGVAFVYTGPIGDHGYTYQHDQGRIAVEKAFGAKVKVKYVENIAEGPDAERVIRELAQTNGLIFTTSFGFMDPTIKVAKAFPNVKFEHATGYKKDKNVAIYNARFYEGRAAIGTIAGMMSKAGVAGYVASFPIPEVVMGINAFTLAAQKINPKFKTKVVWANTWFDPAKEADAAKALMDQGCDIITQHTDSPAPLQAAEQRGMLAFGQASNMAAFAPKACLTSIIDDWSAYYISRVQAVLDGKWEMSDTWSGMKEGMVALGPYSATTPPDVRAAADKIVAGIKAGTFHAFTGPIKDQKGVERVAAGAKLGDGDMLKMDWYVEGVQS